MKSLAKQKGIIPLVLCIFVGIGSFITGIVTVKAVDNHQNKQSVEQAQAASNSDVGVK